MAEERFWRKVALGLFDVNGNAITSMSNATVLEGYSGPVPCFGQTDVIFGVTDVATGTSVAPSAATVEGKNAGDTAYTTDLQFLGLKVSGGAQVGNFWRNPSARILMIPQIANAAGWWSPRIQYDQVRLHLTIGATANLFTPQIVAWVLVDAPDYPLPS